MYVGMDDQERKIREDGSFVPRSGRVFPTWNIRDHPQGAHEGAPGMEAVQLLRTSASTTPRLGSGAVSGQLGSTPSRALRKPDDRRGACQRRQDEEAFWRIDPDEITRVGDPAGKQVPGQPAPAT